MQKCPYCAEEIQDEAIKCRYCGEFLDEPRKTPTKWYYSTTVVVLALLSVGPFALPLVWYHPTYKRATKVVISVVIVAVTVWSVFAMMNMISSLMDTFEQIESLGLH